jgi:hypothetical protein
MSSVIIQALLLTWPGDPVTCQAGWQCDQARQTAKSAPSMGQVAVGRGYCDSDSGWCGNDIANINIITM